MKLYYKGTTALAALTLAYSLSSPARAEDWSGSHASLYLGFQEPDFVNNWNQGISSGGVLTPAINVLNDPGLIFGGG